MKELARIAMRRIGLLRPYYRLKKRLLGRRTAVQEAFYTLSPHLLVAIQSCLREGKMWGGFEDTNYLEFGIYRGFAFWYAQAIAEDLGIRGMRFIGFDSFQGLPQIEGREEDQDFRKGQYCASRQMVEDYLREYGVDRKRTAIVPGFFSDTLNEETKTKYGIRSSALCVMDCDLYEATRDALKFVAPLLDRKAFIIFDDWNCYGGDPNKGQRKACAEFIANNPHLRVKALKQFGSHCQVFLVEHT